MTDFEEYESEIVDCLSGDEPIKTTGVIRSDLKQKGLIDDCSYRELLDFLEDMRERGLVELAHGEWNEYTTPSENK